MYISIEVIQITASAWFLCSSVRGENIEQVYLLTLIDGCVDGWMDFYSIFLLYMSDVGSCYRGSSQYSK